MSRCSNTLNFAVIGCGMLAQSQHLPNIVSSPYAALRLCCDSDPKNACEMPKGIPSRGNLNRLHRSYPQSRGRCHHCRYQ